MLASRQGEKRRMLLICDKTLLNICSKKSKILERTWSEEDAALVRTWYYPILIHSKNVLRTISVNLHLPVDSTPPCYFSGLCVN